MVTSSLQNESTIPYNPSLHVEAVRAMLQDEIVMRLLLITNHRELLGAIVKWDEQSPDWVKAGANASNNLDALVYAVHTFLMDWRAEE